MLINLIKLIWNNNVTVKFQEGVNRSIHVPIRAINLSYSYL